MNRRWLRFLLGGALSAAAAAAPVVLLRLVFWPSGVHGFPADELAFFLSPFLGPLVFTLVARDRPSWGDGLWFALVIGLPLGFLWHHVISVGSAEDLFGWFVVPGIWASAFCVGMAGSGLAVLLARPLLRERRDGALPRLRPWHVGVIVAAIDIVAVVAVTATAS